jgi:hypothetical protein
MIFWVLLLGLYRSVRVFESTKRIAGQNYLSRYLWLFEGDFLLSTSPGLLIAWKVLRGRERSSRLWPIN